MNNLFAVFFADTHLGYDHPLKPRTKRKRRGEDFFANFEFVLDEVKRLKPDFVIHGGDVFDNPHINQSLVNLTYEKFFDTAENNIPVFIIPGNHEKAKLLPSLFMQHPNINIFTEAKTYHLKCKDHDVDISGFPYYYKGIRKDFKEIRDKLSKNSRRNALKIMCMHQVLEGAQVGKQNFTFFANTDVIKISDITNAYDCYLSGHIHRYQLIMNPYNNIPFLYSGSTERTSFQEVDEIKGFCIIRFKKNILSYQMNHEFIPLKTRPLETLRFDDKIYTENEIKKIIEEKVSKISKHAVLRYQSEYPENIYKISAELEKKLIPETISIQKGFWTPDKGYKRKQNSAKK